MEGINYIGHSTSAELPEQDATAEQIIAGMKQIIARVHAHGREIYGCTLTPYEGTVFDRLFDKPERTRRRAAVGERLEGASMAPFDARDRLRRG